MRGQQLASALEASESEAEPQKGVSTWRFATAGLGFGPVLRRSFEVTLSLPTRDLRRTQRQLHDLVGACFTAEIPRPPALGAVRASGGLLQNHLPSLGAVQTWCAKEKA